MSIPSVDDIIDAKKRRFKKSLETAAEHHHNPVISDLTNDLLQLYDAKIILSAMLQHYFKDSMEKRNYRDIYAPSRKRSLSPQPYSKKQRSFTQQTVQHDSHAPVRLFIAKGKSDGYNLHSLLDFVEKQSRVPKRHIREVRILDRFSFFSVSAKDSQAILKVFQHSGENNKALVTIAKEKD
jgi:ATP-dependent RNA helicase DeaD